MRATARADRPAPSRPRDLRVAVTTFQRPEVVDRLRAGLPVHGDGRRRERYFTDAYRWMSGEVARHTGRKRRRYPFWVWVRPRWTARQVCPFPTGTLCQAELCPHPLSVHNGEVQVELQIPAVELLSSDYELWHHCLNGTYLPTAAEWSTIEADCDADLPFGHPGTMSDFERRARVWLDRNGSPPSAGRWVDGHGRVDTAVLTGDLLDELRDSWRRCLLPDPIGDEVGPALIQGCVDHLAPGWVTRYRRYQPDPAGRRRLRPGPWCRLDRPDPDG